MDENNFIETNSKRVLEIFSKEKKLDVKSYETRKAFSEVNEIINHLEEDIYKKIPSKLIEKIIENKDNDYKTNINFNKSINDQKLLEETRVILALIYRDFICNEKEKQKLINNDKKSQNYII